MFDRASLLNSFGFRTSIFLVPLPIIPFELHTTFVAILYKVVEGSVNLVTYVILYLMEIGSSLLMQRDR